MPPEMIYHWSPDSDVITVLPSITEHPLIRYSGADGKSLYCDLARQNLYVFRQAVLKAALGCLWNIDPVFSELNQEHVRVEAPIAYRGDDLVMNVFVRPSDGIWGELASNAEHCLRSALERRFGDTVEEGSAESDVEGCFRIVLGRNLFCDPEHQFWFRTLLKANIGLGLEHQGQDVEATRYGTGSSLCVSSSVGHPVYLRRALKIPSSRTTVASYEGTHQTFYHRRDLERVEQVY